MSTSINDDLMSGGKLQAALFSTDASGNVTGLVGPDNRLYGVVDVAPPDSVPELEPLDWYTDRFHAGDGTYLYGHSPSDNRDFVRMNVSTRARTVVTNPAGGAVGQSVYNVTVTPIPGTLLMCVGSTTAGQPSMRIWRSTDYGDTWALVLTLGTGTNGASTDVWMLSNRNFCAGSKGWYIGEYNVNGSRTGGSANDGVTLWKSTDNGATWAEDQVWNDGSNIIRHIHAIKNVGDKLLICTGDTDAQSAMILWDEAAMIGNVAFGSLPVAVQYGNQRCRAVDVVAPGDGYIYYMGDGITNAGDAVSDVGWFKAPADLSAPPQRLDGKISQYTARAVYYTHLFDSGATCYIEENVNGYASGYDLGIWVSDETRQRIERAGVIKLSTGTTGTITPSMFSVGDTCYVSFATAALGKGTTVGTASFKASASKRWCGVRPDTVHPVYWVNPTTGADNTDTGRGHRPGLPWASLKYALESNRIVQGGRLIYPAGDFEETLSAVITVNADQTNAASTDYLTIEGSGMDESKHSLGSGSSVSSEFGFGVEAVRLEFKDIWVSTKRAVSTQALMTGSGAATAQTMRAIRARLGGKDIGALLNILLNASLTAGGSWNISLHDSQCVGTTNSAAYLFGGDADGPVHVSAYNSVFDGGRGAFNPASTDVIYAENCLFTNFTVAAMRSAATSTVIPVTKDCRFHSFIGLPQWIDDASLSEAGEWKNARCTNPLSPSALFDATSKVDPGACPKDPRLFLYDRVTAEA